MNNVGTIFSILSHMQPRPKQDICTAMNFISLYAKTSDQWTWVCLNNYIKPTPWETNETNAIVATVVSMSTQMCQAYHESQKYQTENTWFMSPKNAYSMQCWCIPDISVISSRTTTKRVNSFMECESLMCDIIGVYKFVINVRCKKGHLNNKVCNCAPSGYYCNSDEYLPYTDRNNHRGASKCPWKFCISFGLVLLWNVLK